MLAQVEAPEALDVPETPPVAQRKTIEVPETPENPAWTRRTP